MAVDDWLQNGAIVVRIVFQVAVLNQHRVAGSQRESDPDGRAFAEIQDGTVSHNIAQYASDNGMRGNLALGLRGLLFSPGKSVFVYIPLAIISVVCFRRFAARYPSEATFVALLSGLWLLIHAKLGNNWFGAWGWGPRHFVTIAPVLVLPACVAWDWMKENVWRRCLLLSALSWGAVLSVASIMGNWSYRMRLANAVGGDYATDVAMVWSLRKGQAVDMIVSSASNVRNLFLGVSGPNLPEQIGRAHV